ncbi:threonine/serine exporter family protein [Soonwooa sp.]|uniref:threonine/serine exporter family protein n=1 Tax=Soonwooa sp. TaxID=1938592 RepID=UPI00262A7A60|nr:threonine/serine exporter family protein [Soonwooa sp.]
MILDKNEVQKRLGLLVILATSMIESGRSISGTVRIVKASAKGIGLKNVLINATGKIVSIQYIDPDNEVFIRNGIAKSVDAFDCDKMKQLEIVASKISSGDFTVEKGIEAIEQCKNISKPWWWVTGGLSVLGFCVALQVGGLFVTALIAGLLHFLVSISGRLLSRFNIPNLFSVALQCIVGGAIAFGAHYLGLISLTGAIVALAVSWMLLVPQSLIISAVLDITNQQYVAGITHTSLIVLISSGILMGAVMALSMTSVLQLPQDQKIILPTLSIPLGILFSVIGATANAMANSGGKSLIIPAAIIGLVTASINQILLHFFEMPSLWAASITAIILGFFSELLARRVVYPAPVLALMGIAGALLPGLVVYNGVALQLFNEDGTKYFIQAALTCICLGIGVTFGFLLASYIKTRYNRIQSSFVQS